MKKKIIAALIVSLLILSVFSLPAFAVSLSYPMDYTITYRTDTGTTLGTKIGTVNADYIGNLSITSPTYTGYVLKNSSDSTVTGRMITWTYPSSHYVRKGTGKYTVIYTKAYNVTVRYITSDGKTLFPSKTISGAPGNSYTLTSPFDSGYTADKQVVSGIFPKYDQTITVIYYPKLYTITYDANGGYGAPLSQTKVDGKNLKLSDKIPVRTGYIFLGWNENKNATNPLYLAGATYSSNSSTTLYAIWQATKIYNVKYDENGGRGAPVDQIKKHNTSLQLAYGKPYRDGYTFVGWGTNSKSTIPTYQPGDIYNKNASITLYAIWKSNSPVTYTVTFDANGGSNAPPSVTVERGDDLTLTKEPTRPNYKFLGWNSYPDSKVAVYKTGGRILAITSNMKLYAIWEKEDSTLPTEVEYKIYYYPNGGFAAPDTQTKKSGQVIQLSMVKPGRIGYRFLGWSTSTTAKVPNYQPGDYYVDDRNLYLYAVWEKTNTKYLVRYYPNGGNGVPDDQTKIEGTPLVLSSDTPEKEGYQFWGWAKDPNAEFPEYYPGDIYDKDEPLHLYAIWIDIQRDFSVSNLTITPDSIKADGTVTVRFQAESLDKYFSYTDVPIMITVDTVMTKYFTVDFNINEVKYISFDLNVGSVAGKKKLNVKINWNNTAGKEIDTSNNSTSTYYTVLREEYDLSIDSVNPNADYTIGTTVITSYTIKNEGNADLIPDSGCYARFTVYYLENNQENIINTQSKIVVVPQGQSNLIYFKWTVPETLSSGTMIYCKCELDVEADANNDDYTIELLCRAISAKTGQTPDTHYEQSKPTDYIKTLSPQETEGSASWTVWEYIDGKFTLKKYGIKISASPVITPGSNCSTAKYTTDGWSMKSGYGFAISYTPTITSLSGYSLPESDAYTNVQSVEASFPEYRYQNQYSVLEKNNGKFSFTPNMYADNNERIHFIPIWYDNGEYAVSVTASEVWTPAGMVAATRNSNAINIDGVMYDDWYQS